MEDVFHDNEPWTPPTEAELKVIQAKRERSDKISHIMGQYLLRGYKMLSTTCDDCGTILLESRNKELYCVACSEVDDNEHTKDNPALDGMAARRQIEESDHRSLEPTDSTAATSEFVVPEREPEVRLPPSTVAAARTDVDKTNDSSDGLENKCWLIKTERQLRKTIETTSEILSKSNGVDDSIRYCALIKASAEALLVLHSLKTTLN